MTNELKLKTRKTIIDTVKGLIKLQAANTLLQGNMTCCLNDVSYDDIETIISTIKLKGIEKYRCNISITNKLSIHFIAS